MPALPCTIRAAQEGDIDALSNIYLSSAEHHQGLDAGFYTVPDSAAVQQAFLQVFTKPDTRIFVAETAGKVTGYVEVNLLKPGSPASMIRQRKVADIGIAVLPGFRGRGVGEALMQAAEGWAFDQGVDGILLNCHSANTGAIRFYERLGYRVLGYVMEKTHPYDPKGGTEQDVSGPKTEENQ